MNTHVSLSYGTNWTQISVWPVLFISQGECECCGETALSIGLAFGPWSIALDFGG